MRKNFPPAMTLSVIKRIMVTGSLYIFLSSLNCVHIHPPPSQQGPCTITINSILPACYANVSHSQHITYNLTATVYYYNGNDRNVLWQHNYTSNAYSMTINAMAPKDNTEWLIEIVLTSTSCSQCALQTADGIICIQYKVPGGDGTYYAAKPTGYASSAGIVGYHSTYTLGQINQELNVTGSCMCIVPN